MKKNFFLLILLILLVVSKSQAQDSNFNHNGRSAYAITKEPAGEQSQTLTFIHKWDWILIMLLIIIDVTLFFTTIREKGERETLIREMTKTREELGREEYLNMIINTLKTVKKYNYWTSHTLTAHMPEDKKNEIFDLYKKEVDNKLLTAKDISKVKFMLEQARHGVEVKVNDLLLISTFRFQIVDDEKTVLGFAKIGVNESRKGILIMDSYFTMALKEHFLILWNSSTPLYQYIKESIDDIKSEKINQTLQRFIDDWKLTDEELKKIGLTRQQLLNE